VPGSYSVSRAGAHATLPTGDSLVERIRALTPKGLDHIVQVAFAANIKAGLEALA
jgi:hypothetical protein